MKNIAFLLQIDWTFTPSPIDNIYIYNIYNIYIYDMTKTRKICIRGYIHKRHPISRGVFCEDLGENWPRYNDIALYSLNNEAHYTDNAKSSAEFKLLTRELSFQKLIIYRLNFQQVTMHIVAMMEWIDEYPWSVKI